MKNFLKAFATVSLISVFTRLISFIFKIYLSRKLGAEVLGLYQICFSILGLFSCLSASGIPVTLSRLTAETQARGDYKSQYSIFSTCLITSMIFAVGTCIIFYAFPSLIDHLFSDPRCKPIFLIILPMLITVSLYCVIRGWFWGGKKYNIYATTEFLDEFLKIILAVMFLSTGLLVFATDNSYALAIMISDIIMSIILIVLFFVKGGKLARPKMFKSICRSSAPLTVTRIVGSFMTTFMSLVIPAILVSKLGYSSASATAEFGRASGMVMPLIFAPISAVSSLSVVLIPEIASLNANNNLKSFEKKLTAIIKYTLIISGLFFFLYSALGLPLGKMLYADELAGQYLQYCAFLVFPMALNSLVVSILNSLGKELQTFISHFSSCAFLVLTVFLTTKLIGIKAYFLSLIVFHTINLIFNLILLSKKFDFEKSLAIDAITTICVSVCVCLFAKLSYNFLIEKTNIWVAFFTCATAASIVYILVLYFTKIINVDIFKMAISKNRKTKM